ncbi:hypothetical protein ACFVR1_04745 [Psychrobacillus sp. NPDC058041]|uniref:hypothetical protein n=1 Tax=Psychrobacillus sp. NPDC058041 TaxID=3346310 RepID=UPI0036D98A0B
MVGLKYFGGVLVALTLCGVMWFNHPAKEQVKQLEGQISWHFKFANFLLRDTVLELLEWNFSQPLTDGDKVYLSKLSNEFLYITDLIFSGNVVHQEWRNRMYDIQGYLNNYEYGPSLLNEDVDDLHQALRATLFISMDFDDMVEHPQDFYDAMHDEQHEMVERVKSRLATQY